MDSQRRIRRKRKDRVDCLPSVSFCDADINNFSVFGSIGEALVSRGLFVILTKVKLTKFAQKSVNDMISGL